MHGLKGPLGCLTQARYGIGWGVIGAAMAVYERARSYAMDRVQFDRPIASFQLTQQKLVELHNEIGKALLLAHHFGRIKQNGRLSPEQVSILKRDNVRMALEAARVARSILGGNGIMGEFHIMRHVCNLETVLHLRGHARGPHARDRPCAHRLGRVQSRLARAARARRHGTRAHGRRSPPARGEIRGPLCARRVGMRAPRPTGP